MDTKWKKKKIIISFLIFFLGVTLTLTSGIDILKNRPSDLPLSNLSRIWARDYQQTARFRNYISGRLAVFLSMAANRCGQDGYSNSYYYYGGYYDTGYYDDSFFDSGVYDKNYYGGYDSYDYISQIQDLQTAIEECREEMEALPDGSAEYEAFQELLSDYQRQIDDLQKARQDQEASSDEDFRKSLAQRYHDSIKGDQNLIYSISWDGQVLYTNSELIHPDGSVDSQEYNFRLYFDGEAVRIYKDGLGLEVYGDGFYREDSDWCVPGYRNFPVNDDMKKAVVCIAVAQKPVLYMEGSPQGEGYRQLDNPLYWIYSNHQARQRLLLENAVRLGVGLLLLIISLFLRKGKRTADEGIARLQGKIWVEIKVLLMLALLWLFITKAFMNELGLELLQEMTYSYVYKYGWERITAYGWNLLGNISSILWAAAFWGIYLAVNDLRHNKKVWAHSLAAKLYRRFTAKGLRLPLSRKMAHRNLASFLAAAVYAILLLGICLPGNEQESFSWIRLIASLLATAAFLTAEYMIAAKNMETARSLDALSRRISDIRSGNYEQVPPGNAPAPASEDLAEPLSQLEGIRQGMAAAVDEQIKSQRMKVELIANVSHDIKTPLTSIISYVQFLKQEEELPEHIKDYVKILDEKSQRLKNMIQDVFAVSKAASGELPVQMEALDFGKLLRQTLADMEEQIAESPLTFRTQIPDEPVMILADGQRMYRVFQNLLQNAIKYSLEGSRVYVTLTLEDSQAKAIIKNTSQLEPEREKDFAERFVRGDQSRTDGGSGLGLSIAQSFTEACQGSFTWETNADLFIVTVSFRQITS